MGGLACESQILTFMGALVAQVQHIALLPAAYQNVKLQNVGAG